MPLCAVSAFSSPVDLGASIITGLVGNPVHTLCKQLLGVRGLSYSQAAFNSALHFIERHGVVFDPHGRRVERALDERVERDLYNRALAGTDHFRENSKEPPHAAEEAAAAGPYSADRAVLRLPGGREEAERMDLLTGMRRALELLGVEMTEEERALYHWLVAELEYGCAAPLDRVSMTHWSAHQQPHTQQPLLPDNRSPPTAALVCHLRSSSAVLRRDQDDQFGFFEGSHAMIQRGYVRAAPPVPPPTPSRWKRSGVVSHPPLPLS